MSDRAKINAYMKRWRDANPDRTRANAKRYNERHRAVLAARRAEPDNRVKARARTAAYRERLGSEERRNRRLIKNYGITLEDYRALASEQSGYCPICEGPLCLLHPHVDHDHDGGDVRGVLCSRCNQAVGMLLESPRAARRLAMYLEKHGKR